VYNVCICEECVLAVVCVSGVYMDCACLEGGGVCGECSMFVCVCVNGVCTMCYMYVWRIYVECGVCIYICVEGLFLWMVFLGVFVWRARFSGGCVWYVRTCQCVEGMNVWCGCVVCVTVCMWRVYMCGVRVCQ